MKKLDKICSALYIVIVGIMVFIETGLFTVVAIGIIYFNINSNKKWIKETTGLLKSIVNKIKKEGESW